MLALRRHDYSLLPGLVGHLIPTHQLKWGPSFPIAIRSRRKSLRSVQMQFERCVELVRRIDSPKLNGLKPYIACTWRLLFSVAEFCLSRVSYPTSQSPIQWQLMSSSLVPHGLVLLESWLLPWDFAQVVAADRWPLKKPMYATFFWPLSIVDEYFFVRPFSDYVQRCLLLAEQELLPGS